MLSDVAILAVGCGDLLSKKTSGHKCLASALVSVERLAAEQPTGIWRVRLRAAVPPPGWPQATARHFYDVIRRRSRTTFQNATLEAHKLDTHSRHQSRETCGYKCTVAAVIFVATSPFLVVMSIMAFDELSHAFLAPSQ